MLIALLSFPLFAQQRLASDFEIQQMEKQLATTRGFEAQLSARLNLGDARSARNEKSLAREEYAKAYELAAKERLDARRDSNMTRYAIATSYAGLAQAKLGRANESFALLEEAVRYTSDDPETWNLYASAMRIIERPEKAVSAARNALALADPAKPVDVAVYQHSLASMLVDAGLFHEAEQLLITLTTSLRGPKFEALRREVARGESFEVYSSARGDVAAYVSLLNRAQLRLASLYERRGENAKAREQYQRVLDARSDDATALAGLARLAASESERERHYAQAFEANPFSLSLVREYQEYLSRAASPSPSHPMQQALVHLSRGEKRAARTILDQLLVQYPANDTLRILRREAEATRAALPSANPTPTELRELLEGFEQLTPEQRVALDTMEFTSVVENAAIGGVPVRVEAEGPITYRIVGVSGEALLLEALRTAAVPAAGVAASGAATWVGGRRDAARPAGEDAGAPALAVTVKGIVVAVNGRVYPWNIRGVPFATSIVANDKNVAILDALNDKAVLIDLETGKPAYIETASTPIAARFHNGSLYILARDARLLQRVGGESIPVPQDSAFLDENLNVYSRLTGKVQKLNGQIVESKPFASDFESGYLVYPRESRIRTIDGQSFDVGAVPVDLAETGGGTAITARILAVADPSAKRIWLTEGKQSTTRAIARGFLRGFLGLGLYGNRSSEFPTGVDRVLARGARWIAYDSATGTLYRVTRKKSSVLAKGIAPNGFALTGRGVAFWQNGRIEEVQ